MRALTDLLRRWLKPARPQEAGAINNVFGPAQKHYVGQANSEARFTASANGVLHYTANGFAMPIMSPENSVIASIMASTYSNYHCPTIRWQ